MTVKEGDFVPLRCNASGRPYPTIMWRREGNAIVPGGGVIVMVGRMKQASSQSQTEYVHTNKTGFYADANNNYAICKRIRRTD